MALFEKASGLGGRAATQKYEEYCFNRGVHALYYGGAASQVLQELGITYGGHSPKGYFVLREDKLHLFPANPLTLLRTDLLDAADKLELTRLFPMLALLKAHELGQVSTQEWLEHHVQRTHVRQLLAALARTFTYSAALDQVSAEVFVTQMQLSPKHNVRYIDGGWQTLVDGLCRAAEQAVFLLREVFDYDYSEIAAIVGKSEANCRQVLHRAHQHLGQRRPRFDVSHEQQERITSQFLRASTNGDMQGLLNLLTDDIVFVGDGGGKARAGLKPVRGADKVVRGFLGGLHKMPPTHAHIEEINGQPAIVGYLNGRPYGVVILDIEGERIRNIYTVLNPDKLGWLGEQPR